MQNIIYKIERLREFKKVSKVDFCSKIGIHRDTLYKLTDDSIKISTLLKISKVLETPISISKWKYICFFTIQLYYIRN